MYHRARCAYIRLALGRLNSLNTRPMIYYMRGGTRWRPEVKNMSIMVNSIFNGWRLEDVWLDK